MHHADFKIRVTGRVGNSFLLWMIAKRFPGGRVMSVFAACGFGVGRVLVIRKAHRIAAMLIYGDAGDKVKAGDPTTNERSFQSSVGKIPELPIAISA
jgi:hypothetical protein